MSLTVPTPTAPTNSKGRSVPNPTNDIGATDELHERAAAAAGVTPAASENGKAAYPPERLRALANQKVATAHEGIVAELEEYASREAAQAAVTHEFARRAKTPARSGASLLSQRVGLGDLIRNGIPPMEWLDTPTLGERLFYRENLFIISGHKKSGKSWAMVATALDCVRNERPAVYIDLENGERLFARRLELLNASADEADQLHYLPFPSPGTLKLDRLRGELENVAEQLPGAFVVVDSLRGLMSRASPSGRRLNYNDQGDVEDVGAPFMEAAKQAGLTVGIIDHAKKTGSDSDEYSTAGSGGKEAAVDAVYFWTKVERFNRDTAGVVKIAATSDRHGELDFERYWRVGGQGEGQPFYFEPTDKTAMSLGRILADVQELLAESPGRYFTKREVRSKVKGDGSKIDDALVLLAADEGEPIYADSEGKRPPRFVWDEEREPSKGLPV